jgi:hypothetical protein
MESKEQNREFQKLVEMLGNAIANREKTPAEIQREEALYHLSVLGGQLDADEDVIFLGTKFVLPETVDLNGAIRFLEKKRDEDDIEFQYSRTFAYRPLDGARAAGRAIRNAFGFSLGKPIITFFGTIPPQLIDVKIGPGQMEPVPWGALMIPGLDGCTLHLGSTYKQDYGKVFQITVDGPRKHRYRIEGLMQLIEEELRENSIYRGKAIDGSDPPDFLDLSAVNPDDVVYTEEVMQQLEANVWSPIKHADALTKLGQPGKRSVVFEGPYGSGKTLGAYLTAKVAVENGWTMVYCRPGKDDIDNVMQTAVIYQPSVIFIEDLDTLAGADVGTIDHHARILDMFDGLKAKGLRMLLVLTTNHIEKLHKAMLRPGRLDAMIHVAEMDRPGVERMVRRTVTPDALDPETNFDQVFLAVDGFMPAFVKEAIDRAVRYSVSLHGGRLGPIGTKELVLAADGLRPQLEMMDGASERKVAAGIDDSLATLVTGIIDDRFNDARFYDRDLDFVGQLKLDQ